MKVKFPGLYRNAWQKLNLGLYNECKKCPSKQILAYDDKDVIKSILFNANVQMCVHLVA